MKAHKNYANYYKKTTEKIRKGQQSTSAIIRDIDPSTVKCPYCGGHMLVKPAGFIQHVKSKSDLLVCENYPKCDTYCSIMKKGIKVRLKSTPANRNLRSLRQEAHWYMDLLMENKIFHTKEDMYWYLTDKTSSSSLTQFHVGEMEEYGCKKVIKSCIEILYNNKNRLNRFHRWKTGYSNSDSELKKMMSEIEEVSKRKLP